ncbi:MAG: cofactor-independent phosphoglycerate mutase [Candidatus Omnitrophota bacterium]|nr:cofactor-independent phosphoglycerate mutase [Candidatus Omnitrophota bacterium]
MKYIILVGDGMADFPLKSLNEYTPLEAAKTPNMDFIAQQGRTGLVYTIPKGMNPASDVANLSILGYDPARYYTGRGPLEAAYMGVKLKADEVAFRCNLITTYRDTMVDYSAGHITTKEAEVLISALDERLGSEQIRFYPGVSYRHLTVIKTPGGFDDLNAKCKPPHDISGQKISLNLPNGKGAESLKSLMEKSKEVLEPHEINQIRIDLAENPANMIWLWGQGVAPNLAGFKEKFGINGSIISAVNLIKGIGYSTGLKVIEVPGATGYYDTDYLAKARFALDSLTDLDFTFVHVEAPDEAGHNGDIKAKITAIENFDKLVVGTILKNFKDKDNYRILVLSDHFTPLSLKTHVTDPPPFTICGKGIAPDNSAVFSEKEAKSTSFVFKEGHTLIEYLIKESAA